MMKQLLLFTCCLLLLPGCNSSENKGARISKLEAEVEQAVLQIRILEDKVQQLESTIAAGKQ